ncbi:MAG: methionine adenosyltransferase [Oscillospiraceae bacterium]|nr:methionine adenosyltransferase [Oscillospiraceae bacterium]
MTTFFSSESVTEGHPDKVCDQIADAILDALLEKDPHSHVACEVTAITDAVHIFGEITSAARVDYEAIARQVIQEIGYTKPGHGFDADSCKITVDVHQQSPDINMGVEKADAMENGAGDQGMMFGYACRETDSLMPLPIELAHKLTKRLAYVRREGILSYLLPDGKAQVTVEYRDGVPARVDTVVVSSQHEADVSMDKLREDILVHVIRPVIPETMLDADTKYFINPTGRFCIGGPAGDSGLTGRKLIVDTYGGYARHGGGAFSGKDPSKVDRSGAYMARYLAKNVVAAGLADRCEIQISYAIGVAQPVSLLVDTFGTGVTSDESIQKLIRDTVDLRPSAIIDKLNLRTPVYRHTASYGHFGSNAQGLPWEQTDFAEKWRRIG